MKHAAAHLKEFFDSDSKVRNLTADRITAYQAARLKQPEREGKPRAASPSTANYELVVLRRAFRLGARAGKVAGRPEIQMLHVENARKGIFRAGAVSRGCEPLAGLSKAGRLDRVHYRLADQERTANAPMAPRRLRQWY